VAEVEVRDVRVDDDAEMHAVYETIHAGEMAGRHGMPFWSEHELATMFRMPVSDVRRHIFAAHAGDRMVGAGTMMVPLLDNLDKAFHWIDVLPESRRRGVGTALDEYARELAHREGRTTMITEAKVPPDERDRHPYRRFAEARGYSLANVEVGRALDLPVAEQALDAWAAEAAPHHADYEIVTFDGMVPDELIDSFCELLGLLALEAPTGDLDFEEEVVTVESLREREKVLKEQGRTVYTTLAVDGSGRAVADSVLAVSEGDPENVYQWATLVHREHRGHRLGLAVKVQNLRTMQAAHPERRRIWTQNGEVNAIMVAINEKLGFKPVELVLEFQRKSDLAVAGAPGSASTTRGV
jgi:GNAT superfamily N-acetyltransferase